jgi:hypothetical protein
VSPFLLRRPRGRLVGFLYEVEAGSGAKPIGGGLEEASEAMPESPSSSSSCYHHYRHHRHYHLHPHQAPASLRSSFRPAQTPCWMRRSLVRMATPPCERGAAFSCKETTTTQGDGACRERSEGRLIRGEGGLAICHTRQHHHPSIVTSVPPSSSSPSSSSPPPPTTAPKPLPAPAKRTW